MASVNKVILVGNLGADPETKYLAISASPTLNDIVRLVRTLNDFDRDGYGSLLGENDCKPFNKKIHPGARDIPDNGIDENCSGSDFSAKGLPSYRSGERMAVPEQYRRDWNVLLLTVDDTRYDHVGRPTQQWNPHSYPIGNNAGDANDGEELWQKLVLGNSKPRDRSEQEVQGYRLALNEIHTRHEKLPIIADTLKHLQRDTEEATDFVRGYAELCLPSNRSVAQRVWRDIWP